MKHISVSAVLTAVLLAVALMTAAAVPVFADDYDKPIELPLILADEETKEEMIARFRRTPPEELFSVQKVKIELSRGDMPGKPYTTTFCSVCGEKVSDGRHKLIGGKPVCRSCAEGSYYEIIDE